MTVAVSLVSQMRAQAELRLDQYLRQDNYWLCGSTHTWSHEIGTRPECVRCGSIVRAADRVVVGTFEVDIGS